MVHGWARWDLTQLPCLHLGAEGRWRWRRSSGAVGTDVSRIAGAGSTRIASHADTMPGAMRSAHRLGAGVAPPAALAAAHPDVAAVPVARARVDAGGPAWRRHGGGRKGGKESHHHRPFLGDGGGRGEERVVLTGEARAASNHKIRCIYPRRAHLDPHPHPQLGARVTPPTPTFFPYPTRAGASPIGEAQCTGLRASHLRRLSGLKRGSTFRPGNAPPRLSQPMVLTWLVQGRMRGVQDRCTGVGCYREHMGFKSIW